MNSAQDTGWIVAEQRQSVARGYRDLIAWLRHHGVKIALNTGFDRDITNLLLSALGWTSGQVDAIVGRLREELDLRLPVLNRAGHRCSALWRRAHSLDRASRPRP